MWGVRKPWEVKTQKDTQILQDSNKEGLKEKSKHSNNAAN